MVYSPAMNQFSSVREAKEYLISRIVAQADRDGVPLSDVERKMLYFSETGWTLPDMRSVNQEFDRIYDQDEYERKIGGIVRRIRDEPDSSHDETWKSAVSRLQDEDHYLEVLISGASRSSGKFSRGERVLLIIAALVVVAVMFPITGFIDSHVDNPQLSRLMRQGSLLALVVLVAYLASRRYRDSA